MLNYIMTVQFTALFIMCLVSSTLTMYSSYMKLGACHPVSSNASEYMTTTGAITTTVPTTTPNVNDTTTSNFNDTTTPNLNYTTTPNFNEATTAAANVSREKVPFDMWYLGITGKNLFFLWKSDEIRHLDCSQNFFTTFLSQLTVFSGLIPISLFVTMEGIRLVQAWFIENVGAWLLSLTIGDCRISICTKSALIRTLKYGVLS